MSRKKRKEKCNKYRRDQEQRAMSQGQTPQHLRVIQGGGELQRHRKREVEITPRNFKQDDMLGYLENPDVNITFAIGPAGTGKTLMATLHAIRELKAGNINKLVITRPAVSVDEEHGFLPGTLQEKMAPWVRPMLDIFEEYYTPEQIEYMLMDNKIEIAPLAYMRGRTFKHAIILADEMQNATDNQMKMLLTRLGEGSQMVVTGDIEQFERGYELNGLRRFMERMFERQSDRIKTVDFTGQRIERHPVVGEVLDIYGEDEE